MTKSLDDELARADPGADVAADERRARPALSRAPAAPAPRPVPPATGWGLPLAVLITGMFMSVLDLSIINVAIPSIRKDLGASIESVQWISTAYSLTEGVMVPASAWLGARFGLKRLYVALIVLFTIASLLCALSTGLTGLIAFRILQAIPGGVLPVTCMTILSASCPRRSWARPWACTG